MFTRDHLLASDWYRVRLESRLRFDSALRERQVGQLERFLANPIYTVEGERLGCHERLVAARGALQATRAMRPDDLIGTLGRDPALD